MSEESDFEFAFEGNNDETKIVVVDPPPPPPHPSSPPSSSVVVVPSPPLPSLSPPRSLNRKKYKVNKNKLFKLPNFGWFYSLFTTGTIEEIGIYYENFYEPFIRYNSFKQTFEGLIRENGECEDVNVLKFEQIHDRNDYSKTIMLPVIMQLWDELYTFEFTNETLLNIAEFLRYLRTVNESAIVQAVKHHYVKKDEDYESYLDPRVLDLGYALYHLYKQPKQEWKRIFKELIENPTKKINTKEHVIKLNQDFKSSGIEAYVEGQPLNSKCCVRVQATGVRPFFGIVIKIDVSHPDEFEGSLHEPKLHIVPVMSMTYINRKQIESGSEDEDEVNDEQHPKKKQKKTENKIYHWISEQSGIPFFVGKQNIDIRIVDSAHVTLYEEADAQIKYLQYYFSFARKQKSDCKTFADWKLTLK